RWRLCRKTSGRTPSCKCFMTVVLLPAWHGIPICMIRNYHVGCGARLCPPLLYGGNKIDSFRPCTPKNTNGYCRQQKLPTSINVVTTRRLNNRKSLRAWRSNFCAKNGFGSWDLVKNRTRDVQCPSPHYPNPQ